MYFLLRGKGGKLFAVAGTLAFPVSVAALISFISLYFYELPTHHCPFCILQREYHYVGYLIYVTLLGGGIAAAGVWALMPFRSVPSLQGTSAEHPAQAGWHGSNTLRRLCCISGFPDAFL